MQVYFPLSTAKGILIWSQSMDMDRPIICMCTYIFMIIDQHIVSMRTSQSSRLWRIRSYYELLQAAYNAKSARSLSYIIYLS